MHDMKENAFKRCKETANWVEGYWRSLQQHQGCLFPFSEILYWLAWEEYLLGKDPRNQTLKHAEFLAQDVYVECVKWVINPNLQ